MASLFRPRPGEQEGTGFDKCFKSSAGQSRHSDYSDINIRDGKDIQR
jgi:hypothetical protein